MKTAVVTDSTAYLSEELRKHPDLYIIPIPVILDGKIYNEGIDIEANDYYELLNNSKEFPTTSQPSIGEVLELYKKLATEGYKRVISIHLSSGISGFVNNLIAMAPGIEEIEVLPFDSKITSMPMGYMVSKTLEMVAQGASVELIFEKLEFIRQHTDAFLVVDDLNILVRGGRLKNGAALIGSMLKIKPILKFDDGNIILSEKIRSTKKALSRAEDLMAKKHKKTKDELKYFIIHANSLAIAELEKKEMEEKFPGIEIEIGHIGPVVGTHIGEKAVVFAWCGK
ncbi:DegV family protein [Vagococcus intermedius]|uniref:DegV family protein n=1 Tax=Vagococcus intermedius TaxID=2991418 RepID=A0AAF0I8N5_9ENTE|nr:DegV family protein [Vagococcus intermedius]WEG74161.1 DegV family protein [Vagococcus intermedius]WEG76241.1 DegV family protein [Vagococcus intermedius]